MVWSVETLTKTRCDGTDAISDSLFVAESRGSGMVLIAWTPADSDRAFVESIARSVRADPASDRAFGRELALARSGRSLAHATNAVVMRQNDLEAATLLVDLVEAQDSAWLGESVARHLASVAASHPAFAPLAARTHHWLVGESTDASPPGARP